MFFLALPLIFTGCKVVDSGDSKVGKACTLMGSSYAIRVQMTSSTPLPPNFAVALNGEDVDVDECTPVGNFFENSIQVNGDRSAVSVVFQLNPNSDDYTFYFPDEESSPVSNLMDLRLYSRATCNDGHAVYQDVSDVQMSWEPVHANGQDCGVTSYTADSDLVVQ